MLIDLLAKLAAIKGIHVIHTLLVLSSKVQQAALMCHSILAWLGVA